MQGWNTHPTQSTDVHVVEKSSCSNASISGSESLIPIRTLLAHRHAGTDGDPSANSPAEPTGRVHSPGEERGWCTHRQSPQKGCTHRQSPGWPPREAGACAGSAEGDGGVCLVLRAVRGLRRCCWPKGWRCCSLVLRAERLLLAPAVQMWTGVVWGVRRCCWLKGWRCCSSVLRADWLLWAPAVQRWTGVVWGCVGAAG